MSCTVTVNDPWPILDAASVAEQSTVVVRMANVEPDAGTQTTDAVTSPSVSSFAVTVKVTTAPSREVASAVMSAGTVTTGGVPSEASATAIVPIWTNAIAATLTMPTHATTREASDATRGRYEPRRKIPACPLLPCPALGRTRPHARPDSASLAPDRLPRRVIGET